ncbi:MAG: hypothetical protein WC010_00315 [Candidatus Absconditabacterales bacterium]
MKTIRVVYTDQQRILAIGRPTAIALLLQPEERIVNNWFYNQPRELESFLQKNPEKENDILKAFSYWIMQKLMGFNEEQNQYGTLKRELQNFSSGLFRSLRAIAGRIAKQIKKFIRPKKNKKEIVFLYKLKQQHKEIRFLTEKIMLY